MRHLAISIALAIHLLMPLAVMAQDKVKGPFDISLRHYGIFLGAALFGGLVAWLNKVRSGVLPPWSVMHLVGELSTSAFAGLLCFWLCEWAGSPPLLTGVLTGVMGHMGTRGIALIETLAAKKFGAHSPPAGNAAP